MVKQNVLVSIDTEGPIGNMPVERMIYGRIKEGDEYGIKYLMKLLDRYNIKGLFFVDIAEAWDYGSEKLKTVLKVIEDAGHDTGVHIHPDHMADKKRRYLWQYSYKEQYEIIAKCTDFYEKALHKKPLSFRAGRYGANNETLDVLEKLEYRYDMSEFFGNKYCKIEPPVTCNAVKKCGKREIIEVPVTSFKSFSTPFYSRYDKIDSGLKPSEFKRVMRAIHAGSHVDVVSFFMHSFSMLKWRNNPDNPMLDNHIKKRIIRNLDYLYKDSRVRFINEKELLKLENHNNNSSDILDVSKGIASYYFFVLRSASVLYDKMILNV